jgi:hypothetical protein
LLRIKANVCQQLAEMPHYFVTSATESTGKEELLSYIDEVNQEVLRIIVSFRSVLNQEKTKYA